MKKWTCLVCLLALFLSGCSQEEQLPAPTVLQQVKTYDTYRLNFQEKEISNDSVGNDWEFIYTYNGQTIQNGFEITQPVGVLSLQSIDVELREKDKFDDMGIGTLIVAVNDGGSGKVEITVTETNGRYKGNTAIWEIVCDVTWVS